MELPLAGLGRQLHLRPGCPAILGLIIRHQDLHLFHGVHTDVHQLIGEVSDLVHPHTVHNDAQRVDPPAIHIQARIARNRLIRRRRRHRPRHQLHQVPRIAPAHWNPFHLARRDHAPALATRRLHHRALRRHRHGIGHCAHLQRTDPSRQRLRLAQHQALSLQSSEALRRHTQRVLTRRNVPEREVARWRSLRAPLNARVHGLQLHIGPRHRRSTRVLNGTDNRTAHGLRVQTTDQAGQHRRRCNHSHEHGDTSPGNWAKVTDRTTTTQPRKGFADRTDQ